jgi:hypothetical protein
MGTWCMISWLFLGGYHLLSAAQSGEGGIALLHYPL